jgi:hypothetical protein
VLDVGRGVQPERRQCDARVRERGGEIVAHSLGLCGSGYLDL